MAKDFGEGGRHAQFITDLKGRNAYPCTFKPNAAMYSAKAIREWNATRHDCADGHCRRKGESKYTHCVDNHTCIYFNQVEEAVASPICSMNFAGFLSQTQFTKRFSQRELIILDEGHNIESQLMNFISITLTDSDLNGLILPELQTPEEYAVWIIENDIINILGQQRLLAQQAENIKRADDLENQIRKLLAFLSVMEGEEHSQWVCEYNKNPGYATKVIFKPVYIDKYAHNYIFNMGKRVLIMSATILNVNVIARSLGIKKEDIAARRLNSDFPVKQRPIYYKPVAKMVGGNARMSEWANKLVKAVNDIAGKYPRQRGIIHTHNFAIADLLLDKCTAVVKERLLYQKTFKNKTQMLDVHAGSVDTIIVAPAMHEGVDLIDDLSRFQIICKIPFANFHQDKQLAVRKELDPQFYDWLTALKLVQSVGRSIRSAEDWADTYIIDESFGWWYKANKKMLPKWFIEAVIIS